MTRRSPGSLSGGARRRRLATVASAGCISVAMLVPVAPAGGATIVKGKLERKRGYTVVGVAPKGTGPSARVSREGSFKLRFRGRSARGATIHFIRPDGAYHGPLVLARRQRKAYTALSGRSASLGRIRLRRGYATLRRKAKVRWIDAKRYARMRRGKPVGAGRLGLVKLSRSSRSAGAAQAPPPGAFDAPGPGEGPPSSAANLGVDSDRDGLTNNYDVDDDGDTVLDSQDPDTGPPQNQLGWIFSNLRVDMQYSHNVNGAPVAGSAIDRLLMNDLSLVFQVNPYFALPGEKVASVNVDCFKLPYCRPVDGTGTIPFSPRPDQVPPGGSRWIDYDVDGDGYPNLVPGHEGTFEVQINPHQPRSGLDPTDTVNFKIKTDRSETVFSSSVGSYFVTTPGIVSVNDGVATHRLSYPPKPGDPGSGGGDPARGENYPANPIQLQGTKLTVTVWRPQRPTIPGAENGDYRDLGRLAYSFAAGMGEESCMAEDFSNLSTTLEVEFDGEFTALKDSAGDASPDPGRVISFTVDLAQCLQRSGINPSGQVTKLGVAASDRQGSKPGQSIWVRLPG
jgi:hypothetical protein